MKNETNKATLVNIDSQHVNGRGILVGTAEVKGVTSENYDSNRVFAYEGKRWVLQSWFGSDCMTGTKFYFVEQHD